MYRIDLGPMESRSARYTVVVRIDNRPKVSLLEARRYLLSFDAGELPAR